jgi:hypothetical protein
LLLHPCFSQPDFPPQFAILKNYALSGFHAKFSKAAYTQATIYQFRFPAREAQDSA